MLALGLVALLGGGWLLVEGARPEGLAIEVGGVEVTVPAGSTLADVAERLDLEPETGDLLDVRGEILTPGAIPGRILLNDRRAGPATAIVSGDRIAVVPGRDRREPIYRVVVNVVGGLPANPQHTLARSRRVEVAKGRLSGAIDDGSAVPVGPFRRPKAVALTFDDGPSAHTREILDVLRRLNVPATFFVVGNVAERRPELVRRMHAYGMAVANHSHAHPYRPPFASRRRADIRGEIVRGAEVITPLAGPPTHFRPPGGTVSPRVIEVAAARGQRIVLWSVDAEDWRPGARASQISSRVLRDVRRGSIVLLHDGGGNRSQTAKALPAIVQGIRARGLELVLLDPS
ncbi:MAG: polysaccharide deacetylase family protein [Gaiellaceae bacterium]